jgi:hypothetical protein
MGLRGRFAFFLLVLALVSGACASPPRHPARVPVADANRVLRYELSFDERSGDVLGRATLPAGTNPMLVVADDLLPFVADVAWWTTVFAWGRPPATFETSTLPRA